MCIRDSWVTSCVLGSRRLRYTVERDRGNTLFSPKFVFIFSLSTSDKRGCDAMRFGLSRGRGWISRLECSPAKSERPPAEVGAATAWLSAAQKHPFLPVPGGSGRIQEKCAQRKGTCWIRTTWTGLSSIGWSFHIGDAEGSHLRQSVCVCRLARHSVAGAGTRGASMERQRSHSRVF